MPAPTDALDGDTLASVRATILAWYASERRAFPWRGSRDPYAVLVSEVMLQQTQAARVAPRFESFMARFPTATALGGAAAADVLAEWTGLGYNRRALNLQRAAAHVAVHGWPRDVAGLESLPGVGPYTARAIASLAFGVRAGVVDTNVRRWLLRRFGGRDHPARLQVLADALAAHGTGDAVAEWTHASMEIGASVCRSRVPRCEACPMALSCPSRGRAARIAVARQAPLRGSDRAYRGAVVRLLAAARGHALGETELRARVVSEGPRVGSALDDAGWERVVRALHRDGLVHLGPGVVRLGAATIAP